MQEEGEERTGVLMGLGWAADNGDRYTEVKCRAGPEDEREHRPRSRGFAGEENRHAGLHSSLLQLICSGAEFM